MPVKENIQCHDKRGMYPSGFCNSYACMYQQANNHNIISISQLVISDIVRHSFVPSVLTVSCRDFTTPAVLSQYIDNGV